MASKTKTKKTKVDGKSTQARPTTGVKTPPIPADQGGLSIGDLKNISTVLDVASTRGAFRANEMATVGLIYNKLQAFLVKVTPPDPKKEGAPTTGTAPIAAPIAAPMAGPIAAPMAGPIAAPTTTQAPATRSIKEI